MFFFIYIRLILFDSMIFKFDKSVYKLLTDYSSTKSINNLYNRVKNSKQFYSRLIIDLNQKIKILTTIIIDYVFSNKT